jgi:hypothetical protein
MVTWGDLLLTDEAVRPIDGSADAAGYLSEQRLTG